jgi:hypothetical protein
MRKTFKYKTVGLEHFVNLAERMYKHRACLLNRIQYFKYGF